MQIRTQDYPEAPSLYEQVPPTHILPLPRFEVSRLGNGFHGRANEFSRVILRPTLADNTSNTGSAEGCNTGSPSTPATGVHSHTDTLSPPSIPTPSTSSTSPAASDPPLFPSTKPVKRALELHNDAVQPNAPRTPGYLAGLLNPQPEAVVYSSRIHELDARPAEVNTVLKHTVTIPHSSVVTSKAGHSRLPRLVPRPVGQSRNLEIPARLEDHDEGLPRKKGRKGPLSEDRKAKVLEVRELGACVRCAIFRGRCEVTQDGQPCLKCREALPHARKFRLPCTRQWLKDRWSFLVPEPLVDHLDFDKYPRLCNMRPGNMFYIPMTSGIGPKVSQLYISAFAVDPEDVQDMQLWQTQMYKTAETDPDVEYGHCKVISLPLMPLLETSVFPPIQDALANLASAALRDPVSHRWIHLLLPDKNREALPEKILQHVQDFWFDVIRCNEGTCPALEIALRTCIMWCLMGRVFFIPPDMIEEVNNHMPPETKLKQEHLKEAKDGLEEMAPRFINRIIKSALLSPLKGNMSNSFNELEKLFRLQEKERGDEKLSDLARDKIFCVMICIVLMVSESQIEMLQKADSKAREAENSADDIMLEAWHCVQRVETEVVDHLIALWNYRFPKGIGKGQPMQDELRIAYASKKFDIIERFRKSRAMDTSLIGMGSGIDVTDTTRFMQTNAKRLLLRLADSLQLPKTQSRS